MQFRSIEIDFDVHKLIEAERRGFDEAPNEALRRLLGFGKSKVAVASKVSTTQERAWMAEGVTLPHGTTLVMEYGRPTKRTYKGQVVDGRWIVEGRIYDSPSGAASAIAITSKGKRTRLNGWGLWQVKRPGESAWISLARLRQDAEPARKLAAEALLRDIGLLGAPRTT